VCLALLVMLVKPDTLLVGPEFSLIFGALLQPRRGLAMSFDNVEIETKIGNTKQTMILRIMNNRLVQRSSIAFAGLYVFIL